MEDLEFGLETCVSKPIWKIDQATHVYGVTTIFLALCCGRYERISRHRVNPYPLGTPNRLKVWGAYVF